jgi:hypothetical protein
MARQRLQKLLAAAGICSRRRAEELLLQGRVQVNGQRAVLGDQADPLLDEVLLNGQPLYSDLELLKRFVTYIPQDDAFDDYLTIEENMDFAAAIRSATADGRSNLPIIRNEREPKIRGAPSEDLRESRRCAAHHPRLFPGGSSKPAAAISTERAREDDA